MAKQATFKDLYRRGRDFEITDETDPENPVTVSCYLKKLNPNDLETAIRRSNAARAKVLLEARNPNSEFYLDIVGDVLDKKDDQLIDIIVIPEVADKGPATVDEVASEEEWEKDGYLQGLRDGWTEGLVDVWVELGARDDLNDEDQEKFNEAEKVFNELQRFQEQVTTKINELREGFINRRSGDAREELEKDAIKVKVDEKANETWLSEYNIQQVYLATRVSKAKPEKYFNNSQEIRELEGPVYPELVRAYGELEVGALEGKDSQETPSS